MLKEKVKLEFWLVFGFIVSLLVFIEPFIRSWYQSYDFFINPYLVDVFISKVFVWVVILLLMYKRYDFKASLWLLIIAILGVCFMTLYKLQYSIFGFSLALELLVDGFFELVPYKVFSFMSVLGSLTFFIILLIFSIKRNISVMTGATLLFFVGIITPLILNLFLMSSTLRTYDPLIVIVLSSIYRASNAVWFLWELLRKDINQKKVLDLKTDQELGVSDYEA